VAVQQIAEWLKDLGMPEDAERFAENRSDISVLPDLTEQHLAAGLPTISYQLGQDSRGNPGSS
jgi:hypothetical protein